MSLENIGIGVLSGLGAGILYGLSGFWKASKDEKKPFDWKNFLLTIVPAALIGGALGLLKLPTGTENIAVYLDGTAGLTITTILKKLMRV
jgi:hypothetical protein